LLVDFFKVEYLLIKSRKLGGVLGRYPQTSKFWHVGGLLRFELE
jgi:hypothetical protein